MSTNPSAGVAGGAPEREPAARHVLQPSWSNAGAHRARFEQLRQYFTGRSVLDLGCASGWRRPDWFHGLIAREAVELVGIDVDAAAVRELERRGFRTLVADATSFDLGRAFDVVHAGELIEHLDDARGFMDSVRRHMRADSQLVLTTPNAFCISNFVYRLGGKAAVHGEHVSWYCEDTLTHLLERSGMRVTEARFLRHEAPPGWRTVASRVVRSALPPRLAWNTVLVVAQRVD